MLFQVLAATLDGNTANRRLIKLHDPTEEVLYKVINPYADDGRHLYFISDRPHLLRQCATVGNPRIAVSGYDSEVVCKI